MQNLEEIGNTTDSFIFGNFYEKDIFLYDEEGRLYVYPLYGHVSPNIDEECESGHYLDSRYNCKKVEDNFKSVIIHSPIEEWLYYLLWLNNISVKPLLDYMNEPKKKVETDNKKKQVFITSGINTSSHFKWAEEYCVNNPGFYILSRENIKRHMIENVEEYYHPNTWDNSRDSFVDSRYYEVLFDSLKDPQITGLILCDNNLSKVKLDKLTEDIKEYTNKIEHKVFPISDSGNHVTFEELIDLDALMPVSVGANKLKEQYNEYIETFGDS